RYTRWSREEGTRDLSTRPGFSLSTVTSLRQSLLHPIARKASRQHTTRSGPHVIRLPEGDIGSEAAHLPDCAAHSAPGRQLGKLGTSGRATGKVRWPLLAANVRGMAGGSPVR
ncbi:MAG TPA: hypothetical protein VKH61_17855, partial [Streptosporangiaceae bacterium]|nr:hypothetical protein [Streptosporangiaceae bacterium]